MIGRRAGTRIAVLLGAGIAGLLAPAPVRAQFPPTPQYLCQMAAQSSQQGGPVLYTVFGQQLLSLIFQQTGGTGVYMPLVQLGAITNIVVGGVNALPNGTFVSCRVFHANGFSDWQIGFSPYTQRIENSTFVPYWTAAQPLPQPQPQPTQPSANPQQVPQPSPTPPVAQNAPPKLEKPSPTTTKAPPTSSQSEACRKFPNLC